MGETLHRLCSKTGRRTAVLIDPTMTPGANPSNTDQSSALSAIKHIPSHMRLWLVTVTAVGLDLWSKNWVFANLDPREVWSAIPGVLDFQRTLNAGAVFGSLPGFSGLFMVATAFAIGFVLFIFAGCRPQHRCTHLALGLILGGALGNLYDRAFVVADVVTLTASSGMPRRIDIGVAIGGADARPLRIGDWPDGENPRIYRAAAVEGVEPKGVVRDFVRFVPSFPSWVPKLGGRDVWPWVFNIADAALVCGVGLLLIQIWFDRRARRGAAPAPADVSCNT